MKFKKGDRVIVIDNENEECGIPKGTTGTVKNITQNEFLHVDFDAPCTANSYGGWYEYHFENINDIKKYVILATVGLVGPDVFTKEEAIEKAKEYTKAYNRQYRVAEVVGTTTLQIVIEVGYNKE